MRHLSRCTTVLAVAALVLSGLGIAAVTEPATAGGTSPAPLPGTVTADALPTWQINGVAWSQVIVGNTVYVTGSFTKARPPGVAAGGPGEVAARNIFAYNLTTGDRVASFDHELNAQGRVITASPDGSRVFVGGDFTTVDGEAHAHLAAFNTESNTLSSRFDAYASGTVTALAATNSTLYVGGAFGKLNGQWRSSLAAVDVHTGSLTSWAPKANAQVLAMTMTPDQDRVIVGGHFNTLNGVRAVGMGSLDASSGKVMPWAINTTIHNGDPRNAIDTLTSDGNLVYGGGYRWDNPDGNFEGTFAADPSTGAIKWINDCHGDTYGVAATGQVVYTVGHAHDCAPIGAFPDHNPREFHRALAFSTFSTGTNSGPDSYGWNYRGIPHAGLLSWFPSIAAGTYTKQYQGAWSVAATSSYVTLAGEFPRVNGKAQQGLVRFAVSKLAPNNVAPSSLGSASSWSSGGKVTLRWRATWDRDDNPLTYRILRDDDVLPAAEISVASSFWSLPTVTWVDPAQPDGTHRYRIVVTDPDGNDHSTVTNETVSGSSNHAPSATMSASCLGRTCSFDAAGSSDADGDTVTYAWDFGDGSAPGTGVAVTHDYGDAGQVTVRMSARDARGATTTISRTVTVPKGASPTTTRLELPNPAPVAGASVSVRAAVAPVCEGRVTITEGQRTLARQRLESGQAAVSLGAMDKGEHSLRATFDPADPKVCKDSAAVAVLKVRKTPTTVRLLLRDDKVSRHERAKAKIKVVADSGLKPEGRVRIYDGNTKLDTVRISGKKVGVRLPRLSRGKHAIRAEYLGSSQARRSTSTVVELRVKKR